MSIVTKKGDDGMTRLASGRRVSKSDARVEAYGTLDELVSFLGLARSVIKDKKLGAELRKIQEDLFLLGAELAGYINRSGRACSAQFWQSKLCNYGSGRACSANLGKASFATTISEPHLAHIDSLIFRYEPKIGKVRCFVIPGDSLQAAALDCARALARRLERKMVALKKAGKFKNAAALKYINRLSDLLWILARMV